MRVNVSIQAMYSLIGKHNHYIIIIKGLYKANYTETFGRYISSLNFTSTIQDFMKM